MAAAFEVRTETVVRLESLAEEVAARCRPTTFAAAFAEALADAADGAIGVKSIAAYRTGLDFDPSRPTERDVAAAVEDWLAAGDGVSTPRLADAVLTRYLLWCAIDLGKPIQLHVGYGDADIVLHRCDPSHLAEFFRVTSDRGVPIMLLHCYPYVREAAIAAQLYPHVYLDTSLAVGHMGASATTAIRQSLEVAPFSKVLFASDAFGLPELFVVGAHRWRLGVSTVIDEWLRDDLIGLADAERYVSMIARGNAERVYGLPAG
jgi:predicted TIM-barrel fold metal-dependent hydrolase